MPDQPDQLPRLLVADRFREDLLLRAGEAIEAAQPPLGFPAVRN